MMQPNEAIAAWQNECEGWLAIQPHAAALSVQLFTYCGAIFLLGQEAATREDAFVLLPPAGIEDVDDVFSVIPSLTGNRRVTLRFLANPDWAKTAVSHGFIQTARYPLMSAPLQAQRLRIADYAIHEPNLVIRQVKKENEGELTAVYQLLRRVFSDTMTMTRLFNPPELTSIFAAYVDGELTASATLWPFASVAGIYSVGTLPSVRKQGLATAVLHTLLAHAQQQRLSHAVLRTIRPLFPVYEPLGFQMVGEVANFVG